MGFSFLDAGGAFLYELIALVFLGVATLVEAITMILLKFNKAGKSFLDAFLVNLVSLVLGFLLLPAVETIGGTEDDAPRKIVEILIMFLITLVIEGLLLMALNRNKKAKPVWIAAIVMNLVSYLILAAFLFL